MTRARGLTALGAALLGSLAPAATSAHTIGGKLDSPLPFVAYLAGAAVAVTASFIIVAIRDPGPPRDPAPLATHTVPAWLRVTLRAVGLIGWLWIVLQAIAGGSSDADVASLFLWTFGWVGLAMVSALVGPAWSWLDPFATLHDLGSRVLRTLHVQGIAPQPYPARLGRWPAIAGFCFFVWLELVAKVVQGRLLGVVLVGYTLITLLAMAQYGRDAWRAQGETFTTWFGLLGRLAPFGSAGSPEDGRVHRRPFASGLMAPDWTRALVVLTALGVGAILFDGLSQTRPFYDLFQFPAIPLGTLLLSCFLGGLALLTLLVAGRVGLAAMGAGLVPVAVGYLVAHYLGWLLSDGQRIFQALSDPFQQGWDLFGTAFWEPSSDWLPTGVIWGLQVAAVVGGHIVGAWTGHAAIRAEAARRGPNAKPVSQLPLALLMIGLTVLTLWSLGQNLVFETTK